MEEDHHPSVLVRQEKAPRCEGDHDPETRVSRDVSGDPPSSPYTPDTPKPRFATNPRSLTVLLSLVAYTSTRSDFSNGVSRRTTR